MITASHAAVPTPTVQIEAATATVSEPDGPDDPVTATVNVSITDFDQFTSGSVTVHYETVDGEAHAPGDYTTTSGDHTWTAGDTDPFEIQVPILYDSMYEGPEHFSIVLTTVSPWATLGNATCVVTILDQDEPPIVAFVPLDQVPEGSDPVTVTVTLTGGHEADVSVPYSLAADPGDAQLGADYSFTAGALQWNDGAVGAQTFTLATATDNLCEGPETVRLALAEGDGYTAGNELTLTIEDANSPTVAFSPTTGLYTSEAGTTAQVTTSLGCTPTSPVTVHLTSSDTSEGTVPESIELYPGPQSFSVEGQNDSVVDGDVTYSITATVESLDPLFDGALVAPVTVVNRDDDLARVLVTPPTQLETSEDGGTAVFDVRLASEPVGNVRVLLVASDPSEAAVDPGYLDLDAATWDQAHQLTVTGLDDEVVDGPVGYTLVITVDAGQTLDPAYQNLNPPDFHLTNLDNDSPTVQFVTAAQSVLEGDTARVLLQLDMPSWQPVTAHVQVAGETATEGLDFHGGVATVTWPAGDHDPMWVEVETLADTIDEPNETVALTLDAVDGGEVGAPSQSVLTITDHTDPPTIWIAGVQPAQAVSEAAGDVSLVIEMSRSSTDPIEVQLELGGTAVAPGDYVAQTQAVTFLPGETSQTVPLLGVVDDSECEPTETIVVTLLPPAAPTPGVQGLAFLDEPHQQTISIQDNETGCSPEAILTLPDPGWFYGNGDTLAMDASSSIVPSGYSSWLVADGIDDGDVATNIVVEPALLTGSLTTSGDDYKDYRVRMVVSNDVPADLSGPDPCSGQADCVYAERTVHRSTDPYHPFELAYALPTEVMLRFTPSPGHCGAESRPRPGARRLAEPRDPAPTTTIATLG